LAVTVLARFMATVQVVPDTLSQPLQPVKVERNAGAALSVTTVPDTYEAEQVDPQLIWLLLAGLELEVTVPLPRRRLDFLTESVNVCTAKVAVTVLAAFMVTVQVAPDAVSHPVQPVWTDPAAAVAVSVTTVPTS